MEKGQIFSELILRGRYLKRAQERAKRRKEKALNKA